MGTRHLTIVFLNGEYKVAQYGQWDGYPSGQGRDILEFLHNIDLEEFKEAVSKVTFLTKEENEQRWKECGAADSEWILLEVGDEHKRRYPENSRDTGSGVLSLLMSKPVKLVNSLDFIKDSLFCEYLI